MGKTFIFGPRELGGRARPSFGRCWCGGCDGDDPGASPGKCLVLPGAHRPAGGDPQSVAHLSPSPTATFLPARVVRAIRSLIARAYWKGCVSPFVQKYHCRGANDTITAHPSIWCDGATAASQAVFQRSIPFASSRKVSLLFDGAALI
jgi:hypothetical protein